MFQPSIELISDLFEEFEHGSSSFLGDINVPHGIMKTVQHAIEEGVF